MYDSRKPVSCKISPGWVQPVKLGGGVRPASQKPCPIFDQNLLYPLPYLRLDEKFDVGFETWC